MKKILVINGPNLNFLGIRERGIYGKQRYNDLLQALQKKGDELGIEVEAYQSNHEGAIIDKIQEAYYDPELAGIVINPAAFMHYSYAIYDALMSVRVTKVEVHITDISGWEEPRNHSVTAAACDRTIEDKGLAGYLEALDFIAGAGKGK